MNIFRHIILLSWLLPLTIHGQVSNNFIVKTNLFQNIIAQNPNLEIEKIMHKRISIEIESIWRRRDWASNGGEWDFGKFYHSTGFTLGISPRYYFSSKKTVPNAWYVSGFFKYNSTIIRSLDMESFHGEYENTVDLYRHGFEIGLLIGRQFFVYKNISADIYAGLGSYSQIYEEHFIAGDPTRIIDNERYNRKKPYISLTIGYFIQNKKK